MHHPNCIKGQVVPLKNNKRSFEKHKRIPQITIIICADMNYCLLSYVSEPLKGDLKDGFEEVEKGLVTHDFKYHPARIDYILVNRPKNLRLNLNLIIFLP
jgi:hypothetical protein